jgi:hypothetical protein
MKRFRLSLRAFTTFTHFPSKRMQSNCSSVHDKIQSFRGRIHDLKQTARYKERKIINVDEIPVWFDSPPQKTMDRVGKKDMNMLKTGSNRLRVTVCLAATMDGRMLQPAVVSKSPSKAAQHTPEHTYRIMNGLPVWNQKRWIHSTLVRQYNSSAAIRLNRLLEDIQWSIRQARTSSVLSGFSKMLGPTEIGAISGLVGWNGFG